MLLRSPHTVLALEARALLTRLARVQPFSLTMPMVPAAAPPRAALEHVERYLLDGRRSLRRRVVAYLRWLRSPAGRAAAGEEAQRRFVLLKLLFNRVLSQLDLFADVLTQRGEHGNGVWLAGLDVAAADALALDGAPYDAPPVICYLDRGHGAAIRRARTRLPGGGVNPVAIIRVPRERMVGSGIAASLLHEVGHQGAALLGLVQSLSADLDARTPPDRDPAWPLWRRWISEIIADFWAMALLGVGSSLGLIGVVSLPRPFVFRLRLDDPHPSPWIRVKLSLALGEALFPDPQWARLESLWEAMYPLAGLPSDRRARFIQIERSLPRFVDVLLAHRPSALGGRLLTDLFPLPDRQPDALRRRYRSWRRNPSRLRAASPSLVFAGLGQARADGVLSPETESRTLVHLLDFWAMRDTLHPPRERPAAPRPALAV